MNVPKSTVANRAKAKAKAKAAKKPAPKPIPKAKAKAKPKAKAKSEPKKKATPKKADKGKATANSLTTRVETGKAGQPPIDLDIEMTRTLAAQGLTEQQIADAFGVNIKTLIRNKKEREEFQEAITQGKTQGIAAMTNAVFRMGTTGNFQAAKYYLNNRDPQNWKEKVEHHVEGEIAIYADDDDLLLAGLEKDDSTDES